MPLHNFNRLFDFGGIFFPDLGGVGVDHLHRHKAAERGVEHGDFSAADLLDNRIFGRRFACEDHAGFEIVVRMGDFKVPVAGEGGEDDVFPPGRGDDELIGNDEGAVHLHRGGDEADMLEMAQAIFLSCEEFGLKEQLKILHGGHA